MNVNMNDVLTSIINSHDISFYLTSGTNELLFSVSMWYMSSTQSSLSSCLNYEADCWSTAIFILRSYSSLWYRHLSEVLGFAFCGQC